MLFVGPPAVGGMDEAVARQRSRGRAIAAMMVLALAALTLIATDEQLIDDRDDSAPPGHAEDPRVVRDSKGFRVFPPRPERTRGAGRRSLPPRTLPLPPAPARAPSPSPSPRSRRRPRVRSPRSARSPPSSGTPRTVCSFQKTSPRATAGSGCAPAASVSRSSRPISAPTGRRPIRCTRRGPRAT